MKRFIFILLMLLSASPLANAKEMFYIVDLKQFFDGEGNPYVELFLNADASTLYHSQSESGKFSAQLGVILEVKEEGNPEGAALYTKSYFLPGPEISDTSGGKSAYSIFDVRRIALKAGSFVITGKLFDKNDPSNKEYLFSRNFVLDPLSITTVTLGSIEYIRSFKPTTQTQSYSKLGYDPEPMITNGAFVDKDSLRFYTEIYNADKFLEASYYVSVYLTQVNSLQKIPRYQKSIKMSSKKIDILTYAFDISELPSDGYYLNIDVFNRENKVVATTSEKLYVSNSKVQQDLTQAPAEEWKLFNLSEAELDKYIPMTKYVATEAEKDIAKALTSYDEKVNYFYGFWFKRRKNPSDVAAMPWLNYFEIIKYVNQNFKSTFNEGWKTDRGRIMLTYGMPNDVEWHLNESGTFPYIIWKFNRIEAQTDVKFIFWDPQSHMDEFPILHSTRFGEIQNPRYKNELQRNTYDANLDNDSPGSPSIRPTRE